LEQNSPAPSTAHPGANPSQELERAVTIATTALETIEIRFVELQRWREEQVLRRHRVRIALPELEQSSYFLYVQR
jgi:hypothetical protein